MASRIILLARLVSSNLPDLLINRDTFEEDLLDCPSALNFCMLPDINEVCRDGAYILHCKLKSFMMRKNARVSIVMTTEQDAVSPIRMSIQMRCTVNEMQMFVIGMLYMAHRFGFEKLPGPFSYRPQFLNLVWRITYIFAHSNCNKLMRPMVYP